MGTNEDDGLYLFANDVPDVSRVEALVREILPNVMPVRNAARLEAALVSVRKAKPCINANRLEKNMAGMGALWGYFPHFADVKVSGKSLSDKLSDSGALERIVRKTALYCIRHEGGRVSKNRVLQSIKAYDGHHVSNFRPVAARDIYHRFGGTAPVVFDPCSGWGGRLLGSIAAGASAYIGIDASLKTVLGLRDIASDLSSEAVLEHHAIEDMDFEPGFSDIAFTSPPYFDAEKYSDDQEQSWKRYKTYPEWVAGFLVPLVRQMKRAVVAGGRVVINIQDIRGLPICQDTIAAASRVGLTHEDTYQYVLSSISGKKEKSEPVFIFKNSAGR